MSSSRANQALRSLANAGFQNRGVCLQAFPMLYAILKGMQRDGMYAGEIGDRKIVLLEMLHSCTPDANKEAVLQAFKEHD